MSIAMTRFAKLTTFRLSREEREAAYNKARERIFGNTEKSGEATPGNAIPRNTYIYTY